MMGHMGSTIHQSHILTSLSIGHQLVIGIMNISRLYTVDDIEGPLDGYYFLRVSALLIAKAKHFQLSGLYDSHLM